MPLIRLSTLQPYEIVRRRTTCLRTQETGVSQGSRSMEEESRLESRPSPWTNLFTEYSSRVGLLRLFALILDIFNLVVPLPTGKMVF